VPVEDVRKVKLVLRRGWGTEVVLATKSAVLLKEATAASEPRSMTMTLREDMAERFAGERLDGGKWALFRARIGEINNNIARRQCGQAVISQVTRRRN